MSRQTLVVKANTESGLLLVADPAALLDPEAWRAIDWAQGSEAGLLPAVRSQFPRLTDVGLFETGGDGLHQVRLDPQPVSLQGCRDGRVAPHISLQEVACDRCGILHAEPHPLLVEYFEQVRGRYGKPIRITDGSRCPAQQQDLSGKSLDVRGQAMSYPTASTSPHCPWPERDSGRTYFYALDLDCPVDFPTPARFRDFVEHEVGLRELRIGALQYANLGMTFIHVDVAYLAAPPNAKAERNWVRGARW